MKIFLSALILIKRFFIPINLKQVQKNILLYFFCIYAVLSPPSATAAFLPDSDYILDREALEDLQHTAFLYMWEGADLSSGMAYEADFNWDITPVAVGGTGFGIAAIVTAVDRGWIPRDQAINRLLKITHFLQEKTPRKELHGAFPHWLNGNTGQTIPFSKDDDGADIVETSLLMQGLLIARAYFNGPGNEEELRIIITKIWEDVDWNWFSNNEENGIYWHWSPKRGFSGLKILGNNECLITYVMAAASPTYPINSKTYNYWTSGEGYKPKNVYGYRIEASLPGAGPLFLTHYSFVGLDPRRLADNYVKNGYFIRNIKHILSNRGYCLQNAPPENRYTENFWGLTACQAKDGGYIIAEPLNDHGIIAPTGAISSIPYTPHYSTLVLHNMHDNLGGKAWGKFGPFDAISLRYNWTSPHYLAIDQLSMVCMIENYRSGLLWNLFMSDQNIYTGLRKIGFHEPELSEGFPEAIITLKNENGKYVPDAYEIRRHPDSGLYEILYWSSDFNTVSFTLTGPDEALLLNFEEKAQKGRNKLTFPQFRKKKGEEVLYLTMTTSSGKYSLPIRLY